MIDAGEVEGPRDHIDFTYEFKNIGSGPLEIKKVRTNCECTIGHKPSAAIAPGASDKVVVRYEPGNSKGSFNNKAFVETNYQVLIAVPETINFGDVTAGETAVAHAVVRYTGDAPANFQLLDASHEDLSVNLRGLSESVVGDILPDIGTITREQFDNQFLLECVFNAQGKQPGEFSGDISLKTAVKDLPNMKVRYTGRMVPLAGSIPSCLFLGEVTPGAPASQDLTISLRNGRPFKVVSVKSSIEAMQCSYTDSLGTTAKLSFHLTVASEADPVVGNVDIQYLDQGSDTPKTLSVPVYGYLAASGKSNV